MLTVLEVTIPVFALVFCGWIAARRNLLSTEGIDGINTFVFMFALPPMMFRAMSAYPVSEYFDARFVAAYLVTALIIFSAAERSPAPRQAIAPKASDWPLRQRTATSAISGCR